MRFLVTSVPATAVLDDGETIGVLLRNESGEQIELNARVADFEDLINAFNEAVTEAFDKRQQSGKASMGNINTGAVPTHQLIGYRFLPAHDQSHLLLQIQTPAGRLDFRMSPGIANTLPEEAAIHVAKLFEPRSRH